MSDHTSYAAAERQALAALLADVGPDRPTLCAGWQTRDLLVHLVLRDSGNVLAAAGHFVPALAGRTEAAMERLEGLDWPELVEKFRTGPPRFSPLRLQRVDAVANLLEFFVHHEDVRRAAPEWTARTLPAGMADALWRQVRLLVGRMLVRNSIVGVRIERLDGAATTLRGGQPAVTVRGTPAEIVLYLFGRRSVARVEIDGPDDAREALAQAKLGF